MERCMASAVARKPTRRQFPRNDAMSRQVVSMKEVFDSARVRDINL